ncbi:ABC transporter ATP-binding protein [Williamsia sp. SKLECPSW1]
MTPGSRTGLSVVDLGRRHRGASAPALSGLTLEVGAGSCTALVGPSGSGKSTALRLVAGLDEPTDGVVRIDGRDVTGVPAESRGVGMVFQRPLLFPHLSVLDNVAFPLRAAGSTRRDARRRALRYLEMVAAVDLADRSSTAISGGQAQRVAVARALCATPSVLLLDEPFSALDGPLRTDMYRLLRDIRAEVNPTIVLVTHDLDEAAQTADRIAVLVDGELHHESDIDGAFHRPSTLAVHRHLGGLVEIAGHVDDGVHHSDLGAVRVPEGCPMPDGPGLLLMRHEGVALCPPSSASTIGSVVATATAGVRTRVTVAVGNARVVADLPPHTSVGIGSSVGLDIPRDAVWVVGPG